MCTLSDRSPARPQPMHEMPAEIMKRIYVGGLPATSGRQQVPVVEMSTKRLKRIGQQERERHRRAAPLAVGR